MLDDKNYIGKHHKSYILSLLNRKQEDFLIRLCVIKRIDIKKGDYSSFEEKKDKMISVLLEELTEKDLIKYLGFKENVI